MTEHILIVEDDENVSEGLTDILEGYGYQVSTSINRSQTWEVLNKKQIHLIILDVNLGKDNGYELCKEIRNKFQLPILFLTGCSSELELIRGFQAGGDDYITKPFRMQELLVRIQALLRRCSVHFNMTCQSGDLCFKRNNYQVLKNNQLLDLTSTEIRMVTVLMENWPRTLTREEIFYYIWDKNAVFVEENTLCVNISRLREKLGLFEDTPYITTVRGIGYRWAVPVR